MSLKRLLLTRIDHNGFEQMPLCSHICDNLYVGMTPVLWPDYLRPALHEFKTVFNLYVFKPYDAVPNQTRYDITIRDNHDEQQIQRGQLLRYASRINDARKEGLTLVHCEMGVNRSNLLAALALMLDGMTANDAIKLLREKRSPYVLMNHTFVKFLCSIDIERERLVYGRI